MLNFWTRGHKRRITIGSHPDWCVQAARETAKRLKRAVDVGEDRMEVQHAERAAATVAEVAERYLEEHVSTPRQKTRSVYESMLRCYVHGRTCWNWGSKTARWSSTRSAAAAVPAWWPKCWTGTGRRSGYPTSTARSRAMPRNGRSAWRTSYATAPTPWKPATPCSPPRMRALLLRAVVLARRHRNLAPSTRREYRRRLECALDAVVALAPTHRDGQRLRKRYGKLRSHLFTFLNHPEMPADDNSSERELRPIRTWPRRPFAA